MLKSWPVPNKKRWYSSKEITEIWNNRAESICDEITVSLKQSIEAGYTSLDINIGDYIENEKGYNLWAEKVKNTLKDRGFKVIDPVSNDDYLDFGVTIEGLPSDEQYR